MPTTNFQCGHCGKLIAVESAFLGQQVRCPHCQQVVVAPGPTPASAAPSPAAPADPAWSPRADEGPESIFSQHDDDDLFGAGPRHVVEMPPEPPRPVSADAPVAAEERTGDSDPAPVSPAATGAAGGLSAVGPPAEERPPDVDVSAVGTTEQTTENPWQPAGPAGLIDHPEAEAPPSEETVAKTRPARGGGNFTALLLIILVPYAIFMTAIAGYLYFVKPPGNRGSGSVPSDTSPLELLPDEGLNPGVRRVLHGKRFPGEGKEAVLPARLRVPLGQSLRVGDLEVTPKNVAVRRITVLTTGYNPSHEKALVLGLHLKNVSRDVAFHPVDPFFDRSWQAGDANARPYTYLDMDGRLFYGGPIDWENAIPRRDNPRQYIPEQQQDRELKPGEEMDTIVCTNPRDKIENVLPTYHGPLVWRVQLRRGLVQVRGRDASATAVIGVEFKDSDVELKE